MWEATIGSTIGEKMSAYEILAGKFVGNIKLEDREEDTRIALRFYFILISCDDEKWTN
jgi:hypothetical protein